MTVLLSIIRLFLAALLLSAAGGKLLAPGDMLPTVRAFGVPARASHAAAFLVPAAELGVGALLVTNAYRWGAAGAAILLLCFAAALTVNLAYGRRPTCNCLGLLRAAPIGVRHVVLDLTAAGLAVLLLLSSSPPAEIRPWQWITSGVLTAIGLTTLALIVVGTVLWVVFNVWRQQARLLLRIEQLEGAARENWVGPPMPNPRRRPAPDFVLSGASGRRTLRSLRGGAAATVLIFTDADCVTCRNYLSDLCGRRFQLPVAVIAREPGDNEGSCKGGIEILYDPVGDVARDYEVTGVPSAVLVDKDGMLPHEVAPGPQAVDRLLAWASLVSEYEGSLSPTAGDADLTVITSGTPD